MAVPELNWLPESATWSESLRAARASPDFARLVALARHRLDFLQTAKLDRIAEAAAAEGERAGFPAALRVAILSGSTVDHLLPGVRTGLLRRGIHARIHVTDYGQYHQELVDPGSALHAFAPEAVVFAFDAGSLFGRADRVAADPAAELDRALGTLRTLWRLARERFGCQVIQQTVLQTGLPLMGSNEQRLPGSPYQLVRRLNEELVRIADEDRVDLLALDHHVAADGLAAWHDPALWHRAKQEISPVATPMYGDLVARLVAAGRGKSAKCLVLDLDNTCWGGVIGDDGLHGIVLGQGNALGEAFVAFQAYAKALSQRGIILAVCSKNDEANALEAFEQHPDMVLRTSDIAVFVANWQDKASNLRAIASRLNIGIDALVFADDNPFERELVRAELPEVAVPELPEDPAFYAERIARAGYFEAVAITDEDRVRNELYRANAQREALLDTATDMAGYLAALEMKLHVRRFDPVGLQRITQLINKSNQFNLMTRRYSEAEVARVMDDPACIGLQLRLVDRLGDNGIIAVVIGEMTDGPTGAELVIDTWLMSCRVLGRGVEEATLAALARAAAARGVTALIGQYRPTAKNGMVRDHYAKVGFAMLDELADGTVRWKLSLADYRPTDTFIEIIEG
ncbi:MAG TPA: HAD-IIIC family phosphatase [Novosphingobium sp.]